MSDALWVGLAYAGALAWCAGNSPASSDALIVAQVGSDLFGLSDGLGFWESFNALSSLTLTLPEWHVCAWADDDGLRNAVEKSVARKGDDMVRCEELDAICTALQSMMKDVKREHDAFVALMHSAQMIKYALQHFHAASEVKAADTSAVVELDRRCIEIIRWIEADWAKNRFPDDPNREGIHLPNQHLLHIFKRMHRYHQKLLSA